MADITLGVLAIIAGTAFCLLGQFVLRFAIPVWGAFSGFAFGAGLVAGLSDERFLGTVLGWVLGLVFALIFGMLAYLYYSVAVVIAMSSIGFALGSGLIVALGIDWSWVAVIVGVAVGTALAVATIVADLPMLLLIVLSSIAGSIAVVTGLMLVTGAMDSADFSQGTFSSRVEDDWWWYLVFTLLAVVSILSQAGTAAALRRSVRDTWSSWDGQPAGPGSHTAPRQQ